MRRGSAGATALIPSAHDFFSSSRGRTPTVRRRGVMSAARGRVVLSHGMDSGPQAVKIGALADVARQLGWNPLLPDYRDLDAQGLAAAAAPRLARLLALIADGVPCVLAGSSFGACVSGLASLQSAPRGLFLLATPPLIPGFAQPFALREGVPACLVHGWRDTLCPVEAAFDLARRYRAELLLLDDDHRLSSQVQPIADHFRHFLARIAA